MLGQHTVALSSLTHHVCYIAELYQSVLLEYVHCPFTVAVHCGKLSSLTTDLCIELRIEKMEQMKIRHSYSACFCYV